MRAAAERDALRAERDGLRADRAAADERARRAEAEAAAAAAALDAERAGEARLREAFQALSADALARNNEAFVQLAEARLREAQTAAGGDLARRQQAIESLVAPLRETLGKVETQIREVERGREGAYASLLQQVATMRQTSEQLRTETAQLVVRAAGAAGARPVGRDAAAPGGRVGRHGRALRLHRAGHLRPPRTASPGPTWWCTWPAASRWWWTRRSRSAASWRRPRRGTRRPGRPGSRRTPGTCARTSTRSPRRRTGSASTRRPEFVVCFVPADVFLDAALQQEPALLEHAFARNVVIATPSTLVAMLRTVGYAWRQEALARNAREVHELARDFYTRLATMGSHVDAVGTALNSAVAKYNRAVSSLESRVLVSARRLKELRVTDADLPTPRQVESAARSVEKEVLVSGDTIVPLTSGRARTAPGQGDLLGGREASGR